jgi:hypothetical protein
MLVEFNFTEQSCKLHGSAEKCMHDQCPSQTNKKHKKTSAAINYHAINTIRFDSNKAFCDNALLIKEALNL